MYWTILLAGLLTAGPETPPADSVPYGVASWPVELKRQKGDRSNFQERLGACHAEIGPVPFF
jgi:hypothetical protein